MHEGAEAEIFHVCNRPFTLNSQPHRLLLFKQLTREMAAQEVAIWKKVIRVIAHELNNSLAPISSLAHSGQALAGGPDADAARAHLLDDRGARLAPRDASSTAMRASRSCRGRGRRRSHWRPLAGGPQGQPVVSRAGAAAESAGWLDAAQIEQVLINLVKNAIESGSPEDEVTLGVSERAGGVAIEVRDRGSGLSQEVLRDALLPFYSTKPKGTGLGLHALPRDRRGPRRAALHRESRRRRRGRDASGCRRRPETALGDVLQRGQPHLR